MPATALKYKEDKKYTYADYLTWDDNQRYEIINGEVYDMSPAPSRKHQFLSFELSGQIRDFLKATKKPYEAYHAAFDVRFPEGIYDKDKIIDVVQPDVLVVCDLSKLDDNGCQGAPDFIIEILSPKTAYKDFTIKYTLYELNKVREYWIIDPVSKVVIIYLLDENGKYKKPIVNNRCGKVKVTIIEGLEIDLDVVFKAPFFD